MELVYLWVDKYKNINEQGFNFSPRFECNYDGEILTVTEKKEDEYIKDFFGNNINVTAIVGENGSGKSNLLMAVLDNIKNKSSSYVEDDRILLYLQNKEEWIITLKSDEKSFKCYKIKKDIINNSQIINISEETVSNNFNENIKYKQIFYTSILDNNSFLKNKLTDSDISINEELKNGQTIYNYESNNIQHIIHILKNDNINLEFDKPKYLYMELNDYDLNEDIINLLESEGSNKTHGRHSSYAVQTLDILESIDKSSEEGNFHRIHINLLFSYLENNYKGKWNLGLNIIPSCLDKLIKLLENSKYIPKLNIITINLIMKELKTFYTMNNGNLFKIKKEISKIPDDFIKNYSSIDSSKTFFRFEYDIQLSSGQYHFLLLFSKILNAIESFKINDKDEENIVIFIDEGEVTLHPNWQKKYIHYLVKFFKDNFNEYNIHLILTTHSPFLLSDLPKENVIFLKDGKNVTDETHINPFGANIHTLLSDGFFMEGGLMGEFAKGKMEKIKKFYEKVIKYQNKPKIKKAYLCFYTKKSDKFWQIQDIIGEPFLKKIVKNQLEEIELILLGKDEAIDNEIARLQALKVSSKNA